MAQSERFYFWHGYYDAMGFLSDAEVGKLFRAICAYAFDGEKPDFGDERVLQVAWSMVADTARESVEMGKRSSEYGKQGGRPPKSTKTPLKRGAKRGAKSTPKRGPESPPESTIESPPESVEYSRVLSPSFDGERVDACALAADAARAASQLPPFPDIPPKPAGDW